MSKTVDGEQKLEEKDRNIQDVSQVYQEEQNTESMKDDDSGKTGNIKKNKSDFLVRLLSTIIMTLLFIVMGLFGNKVIIPFLIIVQQIIYYEVIKAYDNFKNKAVSIGLLICYEGALMMIHSGFSNIGLYSVNTGVFPLVVGMMMFNFGLFVFVKNINQDMFGEHLGQFCVTMTMIVLLGLSFGLYCPLSDKSPVLFFISLSNVFVNDIMAYLCGRAFGKHKLIKLSPNKTWEGYIGALILTILLSPVISGIMSSIPVLRKYSTNWALPLFLDTRYNPYLPKSLKKLCIVMGEIYPFLKINGFTLFSLFTAVFASVFGPLQGLLASAFKRMKGIKDFGNSIPGHGGFLDRFDCQLLTGSVAYIAVVITKNLLSGKLF